MINTEEKLEIWLDKTHTQKEQALSGLTSDSLETLQKIVGKEIRRDGVSSDNKGEIAALQYLVGEELKKRGENEQKNSNGRRSQAQLLVELVTESDAILFQDQHKELYIALYGDGREVLKLNSKSSRRWLSRLAWEQLGKAPNSNVLQSALCTLEAKASFDGPKHDLYIRVAVYDNAYWYDLGDGRVVRTTAKGWKVIESPPILFRHLPHQKTQVEPVGGGDIEELLGFFNLERDSKDGLSDEQLLLLCFVVCGLIPGFPHPALILHGPQGSKKSTLCRVIKELLDPSSLKDLSPPDSLREFVQLASHHWFFTLDNLSHLPNWLSDGLCRVITGGGLSKRELYTDDDDVIYDFRHLVAINGINLVVEKADLLDRSLLIQLQRVGHFEPEKSFWERFKGKKPRILGAMFDTMVRSLTLLEKVDIPTSTRMADFAIWGSAVAEALGYSKTDFLNAYQKNISRQHEEAIEASPVAQALLEFMKTRTDWEGTPTVLLRELEGLVEDLKINVKEKKWPKSPNWLSRRINEVLPDLEATGIQVSQQRDETRNIILRKNTVNTDNLDSRKLNTRPQPDSNDGNDGISPEKVSPSKLKPSGNHKRTIEEAADIFTKPLD